MRKLSLAELESLNLQDLLGRFALCQDICSNLKCLSYNTFGGKSPVTKKVFELNSALREFRDYLDGAIGKAYRPHGYNNNIICKVPKRPPCRDLKELEHYKPDPALYLFLVVDLVISQILTTEFNKFTGGDLSVFYNKKDFACSAYQVVKKLIELYDLTEDLLNEL